jgi:ATP-dependent helicase/DNAse subunit B
MPIKLVTGPANAGKAQVLMDAVRMHLAHGRRPLLVVPTRTDVETYLRELAGEGSVLGAHVERFAGLTGEIVRRAEVRVPALGGPARARVIHALASAQAGAPVAGGFVEALGELFAELQVRRVTPARLSQALAGWAGGGGAPASAGQIGALYQDYRRALERLGRVDEEQRVVRALDVLRERPSAWGDTPVLFYGFDDLTRLQLDAIETLGRVVDAEVTVSLAYEAGRIAFAGRASTFQALEPLAAEHRVLSARADYYAPGSRAVLSHIERSLLESGARAIDPGEAVRLLEGGGERAELELVAGEIGALIAGGMEPGDIAVLARVPGTSMELLAEVFSAAGIPFSLQRRRRFADTALGGGLLGLLRTVGDGGEGSLADLLAWLRTPGLLARPELADQLELAARRSGAVSAGRARELWEERNWPLETIDQIAEAGRRGPVALLDRVARELGWLFSAPRRGEASVLEAEELEESRTLSAGRRVLSELRELARLEPGLAPRDAPELARTLEQIEVYGGEPPGPDTVAVLDPLALRARRVRALFVCGMQEGSFPARARAQPLLGEEERRGLAESSGLLLGEAQDTLAAERYLLYAALSRPRDVLALSWHVADDDGQPTSRSLFVDDVCDLFTEALSGRRARRAMGAVDGMPPPPPPRSRDHGASTLGDPGLLEGLRARVWSASSLEAWIGCPVRWYVERLLKPGVIDPDPEPLAQGGLAHEALKDVLEGVRARTGSARLTPSKRALAGELLAVSLQEREPEFTLSVTPERRAAVMRRLESDLGRYLDHLSLQESTLEPRELELGFGFGEGDERGEASTLEAFDLGDGVRMLGRIDRVDVDGSGQAVVIDYKSSQAPPAAKWLSKPSIQVALYMLAVEQLLGLPVVGGLYQPLSGEDLRARGAIDGDSGVEVDAVSTDVREHEQVRELLERAAEAARQVAAEAGGGELQPRPQSCAYKGGCMYPTICRCER